MSHIVTLRAVARVDWAEIRRSRWLVFYAALYGALLLLFLLLAAHESSLLGFSGLDRVLLALWHALVLLIPLLALTGTALLINGARQDGSLELFLSQPISRGDFFLALTLVRWLALLLPAVAMLLLIGAASLLVLAQPLPWSALLRCLAVTASLTWCFVAVGLWISVRIRATTRALVAMLLTWLASVALLDFALMGAMLQWQLPAPLVFALGALNPVETARLALLSGTEPTLATLGPVGLYLSTALGPGALLLAGLAWPALLGALAWLAARHRFLHGDAV